MRLNSVEENKKSYMRLPALCKEIMKFNPGSRVILQVDSEERIYRVFVMLKSSMDTVFKGCIPCIEVDGTFHKHRSFNGVSQCL